MGGTCSTRGIDYKCVQRFSRKNLKGRNHLKEQDKLEDNIKMDLKEIVFEGTVTLYYLALVSCLFV
jgi:hypothetical protein